MHVILPSLLEQPLGADLSTAVAKVATPNTSPWASDAQCCRRAQGTPFKPRAPQGKAYYGACAQVWCVALGASGR
jgi:hypothetical protein